MPYHLRVGIADGEGLFPFSKLTGVTDKIMKMREALYGVLAVLVIFLAAFICYYPLLSRTEDGFLAYRAIRWDISDFTLPRLIFNSDSLRMGVFPLWNPYPYGGCPWVANFQSFLFHPLDLLIILIWGYSAEILQQQLFLIFFIGGITMYLCARRFCRHRFSALIAAISFLSCGFFVGNASHFGQINTLALFPLAFLMTDKLVERPKLHNLSGAAVGFALLAFAGYPTMGFFLSLECGIYGIVKAVLNKNRRAFLFLVGSFVMALLLSSIVLLPALESASYITRTKSIDTTPEIVIQNSLHPYNLLSLAFPFLGARNLSPYNLDQTLRNCSVGLVGLCLAIYFFIFSRTRMKWLLAVLIAGNTVFALGFNTPIYALAYRIIFPVKIVSHPAFSFRAGLLFFLALSAGMGSEALWKKYREDRRKLLFSSVVLVAVSLIILFFRGESLGLSAGKLLREHFEWQIVFIVLILLLALKLPKRWIFIALIALVIGETAYWTRTNFGTVAVTAPGGYWERRKQKEAARSQRVDDYQNLQRRRDYPSTVGGRSMFWKYFSDGGYDSTQLESFQMIMQSAARGILSGDFRLLPVYRVEYYDNNESILREINSGADLTETALINLRDIEDTGLRGKLDRLAGDKPRGGSFQGSVTYYGPNIIKYEVRLADPALIFFNEIFYPGWILREGNMPIPLFKVNYAFRGAYLEAGRHRLKMEFRPRSFQVGAIISLLTALFCLETILVSALKRLPHNLIIR